MRKVLLAAILAAFSVLAVAQVPGPMPTLPIQQGATFSFQLQLKGPTGTPINLTGYTAAAQIRRNAQSPTALATFTITMAADLTTGIMTLSLDPTTTGNMQAPDSAVWDLFLTDPTGAKFRLLAGPVLVSPRVTR